MTVQTPFRGPSMPAIVPWSDDLGTRVFDDLDENDMAEAMIDRGAAVSSRGLWADWRATRGTRLLDVIAVSTVRRGCKPFAVFAVAHSGRAGVGDVALLTRHVPDWRMEIGRLAAGLRIAVPAFCADLGIHRLEARSWTGHPTGGRLLVACGFPVECRLHGFGPDGRETFDQHAWTTAGDQTCA